MKKVYYFAYGSNILQERLEQRVGNVTKFINYRLHGYKLVFDTSFAGLGSCFANIEPAAPEDFVEGVLYDINAKQLKQLDVYEGLYLKQFFGLPDGSLAAVYVNDDEWFKSHNLPNLNYLNIILQGCANQGLAHTLEVLQVYKKANFKLRSYKKYKLNEAV